MVQTLIGVGVLMNKSVKKMKKIFLAIVAVSIALFVGCKKDTKVVTLGVQIEKATSDYKLNIDADRNPVFLQSGEQVNVNGTNYDVVYSNGKYWVDVQAEDGETEFYGAYPTTLFNTLSTTGFTGTTNQPVHLSRWQQYEQNGGVQNVKLPAAAVLTDDSKKLKFYNLCSLLEIQWTNTSENYDYDIIGIEVTVPGTALYGDGKANLIDDADNNIVRGLTMTGTGEKYNRVNLDITEDDRETVGHTENHNVSRKYYVILPPFTSKNVTVRIQTLRHTEGEQTIENQKIRTITAATTSAVNLPRNYIVPLHISSEPIEDNGLTGYFSVDGDGHGNDTYKVVFSRGNLQHVNSNNPSSGDWKFADRQYDFFGQRNLDRSGYNLSTTVDLFCWSESEEGGNYFGMYTYDPDDAHWQGASTTYFKDWGDYKVISGDPVGTWFTLSADQWYYLFHSRVNGRGDQLRGKATITQVKGHSAQLYEGESDWSTPRTSIDGFILLPDDWTSDDVPSGLSFSSTGNNEYTASEWARMEAAGAMFLPAAGWGSSYHDEDNDPDEGNDIYNTYQDGQYWSSTRHGQNSSSASALSYYVHFNYSTADWYLLTSSLIYSHSGSESTSNQFANYDLQWWRMRSVRLVKSAPGYTRPSSSK